MNTLKTEYLKRALDNGNKNAVNLVREFFDGGIADNLAVGSSWVYDIGSFEWNLADLDRALEVMEKNNE